MNIILSIIEVIILLISVLISVAYLTVAERKTLGFMQRRLGPNNVGYYGLLMAFADALKLLLKEIVFPHEANYIIMLISPLITLISALLGWAIIPFGPAITLADIEYGFLYSLAISSIGVFGTLLVGWASNSKYSLLGSIRSTAQLISYELVLTTIIIICLMFSNTLNFTLFIENQQIIWLFVPLFPLSILFFISSIAETSRPPFDLTEAESELVSGHMTELSASPFVLFFLAEYNNIMLMCALNVILFFGGYWNFNYLIFLPNFFINNYINYFLNSGSLLFYFMEGLFFSINFALKLNIFMFIFIWARAAFPRIRYDQLILLCWLIFLPLCFGFFLLIPSILYIFNSFAIAS